MTRLTTMKARLYEYRANKSKWADDESERFFNLIEELTKGKSYQLYSLVCDLFIVANAEHLTNEEIETILTTLKIDY